MRQRALARGAWIGAVAALVAVSIGFAQATIDPALQGRLLRRSDGALFIYKDGVRYPVLPAELSDEQIDAMPQVGLQVTRVSDLFAVTLGPSTGSMAMGTTDAPSVSILAPGTGPLAPALAELVGQSGTFCDLLGNPIAVQVERADQAVGTDQRPHVLLVVHMSNVGAREATGQPPVGLRDSQGRFFQRTSTGLGADLATLARQLGIDRASEQVLSPGLSERQLWSYQMPEDVQGLSLLQNPQTRCGGASSS